MDTRSILLDIVKHTAGLGIIENLKITGSDSTNLDAMDTDRTVILNAQMHSVVKDFDGEFGMGNLGLLSSLLKLSNYAGEDASVKVIREERNGVDTPTTIVFEDGQGSKDQYRFMSTKAINEILKVGKFKGANWNVEIQPSTAKVTQLGEVASIYSGIEPTFNAKTENGALVFEVGSNEGGIIGRRKFADNVGGELDQVWSYNLNTVLSILKLGMNGTCVMKFSDQGVCQIDVDSGLGIYSYILPAISR